MAPKRRDNKGRILQMGEWQEPNGRYRYIYNDALGKRKIIYSWRLTEADPVPAHVCRHTYCSNMAKSGMNPKAEITRLKAM